MAVRLDSPSRVDGTMRISQPSALSLPAHSEQLVMDTRSKPFSHPAPPIPDNWPPPPLPFSTCNGEQEAQVYHVSFRLEQASGSPLQSSNLTAISAAASSIATENSLSPIFPVPVERAALKHVSEALFCGVRCVKRMAVSDIYLRIYAALTLTDLHITTFLLITFS